MTAKGFTGHEELNSEAKEKKRKPNFSVYKNGVITENVKKHLETIQLKLRKNITNKTKQEIWEEIPQAVNAMGTANRTVSEVKDKWKNLHSTTKKEFLHFSKFKRESRKTGGGPPLKPPSVSSKEITEVFEDTPGFSGMGLRRVCKQTVVPRLGNLSCDYICTQLAIFFLSCPRCSDLVSRFTLYLA